MNQPVELYLTNDPEANALNAEDPLALLVGLVLHQQVPTEKAFHSPLVLRTRLGRDLDAGEIAAMDWSHVNFSAGLLIIPDTKNGKSRTIPLSVVAQDILQNLMQPEVVYLSGKVWNWIDFFIVSLQLVEEPCRAMQLSTEIGREKEPGRGSMYTYIYKYTYICMCR